MVNVFQFCIKIVRIFIQLNHVVEDNLLFHSFDIWHRITAINSQLNITSTRLYQVRKRTQLLFLKFDNRVHFVPLNMPFVCFSCVLIKLRLQKFCFIIVSFFACLKSLFKHFSKHFLGLLLTMLNLYFKHFTLAF